ncbi:hypothetical protein QFC21_006067 [Naganishia friedmannii]|uniref:Uncharacterized protein n=1 Tax=Naganishia friedmannii TaxID=89922 RepID=A0ACC2V6G8_9TREE|nr:hypothetical protein QFC21_006067 [Naganishia friedmannii]
MSDRRSDILTGLASFTLTSPSDGIVGLHSHIKRHEARIQELEQRDQASNYMIEEMQKRIEMLEERLSPKNRNLDTTCKLPLELLCLVGNFLAGGNAYATLANHLLTCHAVHDELKSTLYETTDDYTRRESLKHTKFLIAPRGHCLALREVFPNLRVEVTMDLASDHSPLQLPCRINIHKSVDVLVLSELSQIPLVWWSNGTDSIPRGIANQIVGVSVKHAVWVTGAPAHDHDSWICQGSTPDLHVTFVLKHNFASYNLRRTMQNLLWLTLVVDRRRLEDPKYGNIENDGVPPFLEFRIAAGSISVANLILDVLGFPLLYSFYANVIIKLLDLDSTQIGRAATEDEIGDHMSKAAALFSHVWLHMNRHDHTKHFYREDIFYVIDYNHGTGKTLGSLRSLRPSEDAFKLHIIHIDQNGANAVTTRTETFEPTRPRPMPGAFPYGLCSCSSGQRDTHGFYSSPLDR